LAIAKSRKRRAAIEGFSDEMLHTFQPASRLQAKSSRALLREIERAAQNAAFTEDLGDRMSALGDLEVQDADHEAQAELMRGQVDAFLKQQVREVKRQAEEAQAVRHLLRGCLKRVKEESLCLSASKKEAEMMREQVNAFLEQQVHEAKPRVEETQAMQHLLRGCFRRAKEESLCLSASKKEAELMREQVNAFLEQQVHEAKPRVEESQAMQHLLRGCLRRAKQERTFRIPLMPVINAVPCEQTNILVHDAENQARIENCHQEHMQLKIALAASQAEAASSARKSDAFQGQLVASTLQNEQLTQKLADCQKESDERTGAALRKEKLFIARLNEKQEWIDHLQRESADLRQSLTDSQEESAEVMCAAVCKERSLTARSEEKQERIDHLLLERLELRSSLAQRGDANAVICCLDALQRDYDKLAHDHAKLKRHVASCSPEHSAKVVSAEPLVLGVEAQEDVTAQGVVTEMYTSALTDTGCCQAFSVGRVRVPINAGSVPVCAQVLVENDGDSPWPVTLAAALVSGDALGCPVLTLDSAGPGQRVDLSMDFLVPAATETGIAVSMWALVNAATGRPLGPLLVFEIERTAQ